MSPRKKRISTNTTVGYYFVEMDNQAVYSFMRYQYGFLGYFPTLKTKGITEQKLIYNEWLRYWIKFDSMHDSLLINPKYQIV